MRIELLVKVGNSNPARHVPSDNWRDGMVVHWQPQGEHLIASTYLDWLDRDVLPPTFVLWPHFDQQQHRRRMQELRYLLDPRNTSLQVARRIFEVRDPQPSLVAEAAEEQAKALRDRAKIEAHGYDLRWGWSERRSHGIAMVDVTEDQMQDLLGEELDEGRLPAAPPQALALRAFRFPYEKLLSPASVDHWKDPDHTLRPRRDVTPFRGSPILERAPLP